MITYDFFASTEGEEVPSGVAVLIFRRQPAQPAAEFLPLSRPQAFAGDAQLRAEFRDEEGGVGSHAGARARFRWEPMRIMLETITCL